MKRQSFRSFESAFCSSFQEPINSGILHFVLALLRKSPAMRARHHREGKLRRNSRECANQEHRDDLARSQRQRSSCSLAVLATNFFPKAFRSLSSSALACSNSLRIITQGLAIFFSVSLELRNQ
mmetsp:Transcript_43759/g.70340  ORF Transcript_43759/g.70340 Transcript_43759/m.70340 type:complete len:124 (-) Transcript_43759:148-519(-)